MGYLKDKYTKEYYTGKDAEGNQLKYGATSSIDEKGHYTLRKHDMLILEKINFKDKNVLVLGCGRGEELVSAIENDANVTNTIGVDFSPAAIKIAKDLFKNKKLKSPQFFTEDALDFVTNYSEVIKDDESKKFDIVIMFDFVEHVPRGELIKIFKKLKQLLKKESVLVINTPAYKYDNDVIKNGYDERNQIDSLDTSDIVPQTKGMHCNKYSLISLQEFMNSQGFYNITEAHYFVSQDLVRSNFINTSYYNRWNICKKNGLPLLGEYTDDIIENPYPSNADLKLIKFKEGILEGISLFSTQKYSELAYPNGNIDIEMFEDITAADIKGKTIFDVGTFIGANALVFSKLVGSEGKVIGFEPNLFNRNRSFLNISQNPNFSDNIFIYQYALGKENKEEKMFLSSEIDNGFSSTSRLKGSHSKIEDSELPEGFEDISVQVKTLDTFVEEENLVPDILKVDIEGAEYDFLLGALNTIKKHKPIFYIEIHSEFCAIRCFEILRSEGYSVTIINEESDNRIMLKAEYIDTKKGKKDSIEIRGLQAQRNLDATLGILKSVNSLIEIIKRDLNEVNSKNEDLKQREMEFKGERDGLIEKNKKLEEERDLLKQREMEFKGERDGLIEKNKKLEEERDLLKQRNTELEKENKKLGKEGDLLKQREVELNLRNSKLEETISSIENSKSWRITKPLRSIRHIWERSK